MTSNCLTGRPNQQPSVYEVKSTQSSNLKPDCAAVREVVLAIAIFAPLVTNIWFSVLGGTGLGLEVADPGSVSEALASNGLPAALLAILQQLPLSAMLIPAFVVLTFVFLTTSADSMAYSVSIIVSGQDTPPRWLRAFWAVLMGAVACVLLAQGEGAVQALQQLIVVAAVPVGLVMATTLVTAPWLLWRHHTHRRS